MKAMTAVMIGLTLIGTQSTAQIRRGRAVTGGRIDETTRIINDCERRTNSFKKTLDRALARDNVRAGEGRENQLNNNASRLENELDRVGDSWNRDHDMNKTRTHVRAALALGSDINRAMRSWNMGGDAESEWAAVRGELNRLASNFGLPRIR
jgi:hypothetical protein